MFILKKGHQPGVYVPLRALFLVFPSDPKVFIGIPKKMKFYHTQPTLFAAIFYWFCHFRCHI